jgi:hypothetical protein
MCTQVKNSKEYYENSLIKVKYWLTQYPDKQKLLKRKAKYEKMLLSFH